LPRSALSRYYDKGLDKLTSIELVKPKAKKPENEK
jgi:hypothetical protein